MRLLLLNSAIFACFALASSASLATRQYASLVDSLKKLNSKIAEFDTQINSLTLNSSAAASSNQLATYSDALVISMKDTTAIFSRASVIQFLFESADLVPQIPKLTSNSEMVVDSLISKKEILIKLGLVETARKQLEAQKAAIDNFVKAISSKLPSAVKPASDAIIGELAKVYNIGLAALA
jgi:hypothetical protein